MTRIVGHLSGSGLAWCRRSRRRHRWLIGLALDHLHGVLSEAMLAAFTFTEDDDLESNDVGPFAVFAELVKEAGELLARREHAPVAVAVDVRKAERLRRQAL